MRPKRPGWGGTRAHRRGLAASAAVAAVIGLCLALAMPSAAAARVHHVETRTPSPAHNFTAAMGTTVASNAVSKSKHVSRVFLDNGVTKTVDSRTVQVSVSDTKNLRSLQQIQVKWSGAHVTQGLELDPNSDLAMNEEYSFDLFECRGVDSTSVPKSERLSPQTCWTQFADERYFAQGANAAWQSDLYATPSEREDVAGAPPLAQQPKVCQTLEDHDVTQRWLPFVGANGRVYHGGSDGCAGLPPEDSPENLSNLSLPSNETFGVTAASGSGSAQFDVFTGEDHASLGCSDKVPCSLVAIPIEGLSCDPEGANLPLAQQPTQADADANTKSCESKGVFKPGQLLNGVPFGGAPAVDGTMWWAPSNWRNRISFPLTFAEADNICDIVTTSTPISVYGSELMQQAAIQWSPHFCLNSKLFNLKLVQTPEPEARRLVDAGSIEAAVSGYGPSPPFTTPTVNAPIGVTGFGIAFQIDNNNNHQVIHLNLDARLLAKLLTESYPANPTLQSEYPKSKSGAETLSTNPLSLAQDPEFQALNPGIPARIEDAASTLLTLNVQSDVMTQLTTYINDDAAARTWLDGKPDPWGMRVNPNYQGIKLPVTSWPLLDSFEPKGLYQLGINDCLAVNPVPYLPLVANPQASLYQIALDEDFAIAQSQTTCVLPSPIPGDTKGSKLVAVGRQPPGDRFMLSVVSLADAARFNLPLASLETHTTVPAGTKFTSAAGQTFVAPNAASMKAAVATITPDRASGTWPLDFDTLRSTKYAGAYPGTMVMYASIPTKGLPAVDAKDYANFLRFTAGAGQVQGDAPGDLAAGYLPLTARNGLGALVNYTHRAAAAVVAQKGASPSLAAPASTRHGDKGRTGGKGRNGSTPPPGAPQTQPLTTPITSTPPTSTATSPDPGTKPAVAPKTTPAALGITKAIAAGFGGNMLPILFVALLLSAGAAAGIRLRLGRGR